MHSRFVVAQNRQAVHVHDPLKLAHRLEVLGGTASFMGRIADKQKLIVAHNKDCNDLTDEISRWVSTLCSSICFVATFMGTLIASLLTTTKWQCRVQQQRQQLVPHVTQWKEFEVKAAAFQKHKITFLQQQTRSVSKAIEMGSLQVCKGHQGRMLWLMHISQGCCGALVAAMLTFVIGTC